MLNFAINKTKLWFTRKKVKCFLSNKIDTILLQYGDKIINKWRVQSLPLRVHFQKYISAFFFFLETYHVWPNQFSFEYWAYNKSFNGNQWSINRRKNCFMKVLSFSHYYHLPISQGIERMSIIRTICMSSEWCFFFLFFFWNIQLW